MRILLDTNAVLWAALSPCKLIAADTSAIHNTYHDLLDIPVISADSQFDPLGVRRIW